MSRYRISPNAACARVSDGAVLLHLGSKRYYSLNESGAVIWNSLEEGRDVTQIVVRLQSAYEVNAMDAQRAVEQLLGELATADLIVDGSA